jgi:hypothetical protein
MIGVMKDSLSASFQLVIKFQSVPLLWNPYIGRTIPKPQERQGYRMFQTEESDLGNTESQPPSTSWARYALQEFINDTTKEVSAPSAW